MSPCAGVAELWLGEGGRLLSGAGGAVLEIIEMLLGEVDGYGVNCICKLESHL